MGPIATIFKRMTDTSIAAKGTVGAKASKREQVSAVETYYDVMDLLPSRSEKHSKDPPRGKSRKGESNVTTPNASTRTIVVIGYLRNRKGEVRIQDWIRPLRTRVIDK